MRPSLFERARDSILEETARVSTRSPVLVLLIALLFAAIGVASAVLSLEVRTDRNDLIREGRDWNERFEAYRANFSGTRDLIVVLRGPREARRGFVDAICAVARPEVELFDQVFCGLDPEPLRRRSLLFFDEAAHEELEAELKRRSLELQRLTARPSLEATLRFVDRATSQALVSNVVSGLFETASEDEAQAPVDLSFLNGLLEGMEAELAGELGDAALWSRMFGPGGGRRSAEYLESKDGRLGFILATPKLGADRIAIDFLESSFAVQSARFPTVEAGITGQRAINAAELRATVRDTRRAGLLALLGVALIFGSAFGRVANPILALVALLFGIAWSAGTTTWLVGHLTVLSVGFTSILVGLGIDFGIHVVARYEDSKEPSIEASVRQAVLLSGPGNVAGALTTALAFYSVGLSDFLGIAELGVIAGSGVLCCLLASITVLPALLTLAGRRPKSMRTWRLPLIPRLYVQRGGLLTATALVTVAAGSTLPFLRFDANLLNLQAEGVEAVDLELELVELEGQGSAFAVSVAKDLAEARLRSAQLEALPTVAEVESMARLIPPDQERRAERARALAPLVEPLRVGTPAGPSRIDRLKKRLEKLRFKLRPEKEETWGDGRRPEQSALAEARQRIDAVLEGLNVAKADALNDFESRLVRNLGDEVQTLRAGIRPLPMTEEVLPEALRQAYRGKDGRYLLRIRPTVNIWEPDTRAEFIRALRVIDPEVTGIPVQAQESSKLMLRGYLQGGLYSLLVVLVLLWLDLRSPRLMMVALSPLLLGGLWTCGVMFLSGLQFNLANLVILPLMIGIGIDIGVHMTHRFVEDGEGGLALVHGSTGRAVVVSGLTTMAGFGSLAIARHQGIQSIGLLLAVGVAANLIAAVLVLAPLLAQTDPRS
ncbi:MAG: MMPL family transporter [Myxococcota bacterium]